MRSCVKPEGNDGASEAPKIDSRTPAVTRDQLRHAKPDPDLFLAAAERLGVSIQDSVIVGDSVWDLLAACRARALGAGLASGGYGPDELERRTQRSIT